MTADEFAALVPELYHRTPWKNLPGIRRHGLLPTAQLLALYGVDTAGAAEIEQQRAKLPVCVQGRRRTRSGNQSGLGINIRFIRRRWRPLYPT